MLRPATYLLLVLRLLHGVSSIVITSGGSEWGSLCKLNTSDFAPENLDNNNRLLSLFPGLRGLDTWANPSLKPCCFPRSWESEFTVHTRRIGRRPRADTGLYRIQRNDTSSPEIVVVMGKTVLATSLCKDWKGGRRLQVCKENMEECLRLPYLGEPRCISPANGFHFIQRPNLSSREMWFTDTRLPTGGMKRHIYTFSRKYDICKLESYQILTGQYVDSKRSCRIMFLMDEVFTPIPGTFRVEFEKNATANMFRCQG